MASNVGRCIRACKIAGSATQQKDCCFYIDGSSIPYLTTASIQNCDVVQLDIGEMSLFEILPPSEDFIYNVLLETLVSFCQISIFIDKQELQITVFSCHFTVFFHTLFFSFFIGTIYWHSLQSKGVIFQGWFSHARWQGSMSFPSLGAVALLCVAFGLAVAARSSGTVVDGLLREDDELVATMRQEKASPCTTVRIPWNLCPACKLKPFTGKGAFLNFNGVNRYDIYDLSTPRCKNELRRYVRFNPCDTVRRNAVYSMNKKNSKLVLIYFMYSLCETCCDCVPIGAKLGQYAQRKAANTLINIARGNCAAHFIYDTCKIWPKAGQITGLYGKQLNLPQHCPDFKNWIDSPASNGWLTNNNVGGLTPKMKRAMTQLTNTARCREETLWKNCVRMESAQRRV